MARALISATAAATNSSAVQTETVRENGLTGTDGLYVAASVDVDDKLCLYVRETADGATGTIWIKGADAADGVPNSGAGDLSVTVGGLAAVIVGPLERACFGQSDGTINVDWGVTGIAAVIDLSA